MCLVLPNMPYESSPSSIYYSTPLQFTCILHERYISSSPFRIFTLCLSYDLHQQHLLHIFYITFTLIAFVINSSLQHLPTSPLYNLQRPDFPSALFYKQGKEWRWCAVPYSNMPAAFYLYKETECRLAHMAFKMFMLPFALWNQLKVNLSCNFTSLH